MKLLPFTLLRWGAFLPLASHRQRRNRPNRCAGFISDPHPILDHLGGPGMTRIDVTTTLEPSPVTWIRVEGSLDTPTEIALLGDTMGLLPLGATIVIDLDTSCELGAVGADALGALARQVAADHGQMIILAGDLVQRTRLVLAEVDHRATLLHTASQVERLLGHAA